MREKTSESNAKNGENLADSTNRKKIAESKNGLPRLDCVKSRNDGQKRLTSSLRGSVSVANTTKQSKILRFCVRFCDFRTRMTK
ncbi:hypothetical protein [Helicobacter sp. 23-1045]